MTRSRGFTLVEVLVALVIMATMAGLAWQGLDGVLRARDAGAGRLDRTTRLDTVITQWEQDLAALHDDPAVPALGFDGQTLRLTREAGAGVQLVAWSLREGVWRRWASPPTARQAELREHWLRSQQLLGNEPGQLRLFDGVADWQVYFYRGNAWSNAQSSGDVAAEPATAAGVREQLPAGVRLVVDLGGGALTRDVALAPQPR
jgi:general secretion pathway protein J